MSSGLPADGALLALLHLCDSAFPTGAFAHSDGLEAAVARGEVAALAGLREWVDTCLDEQLTRCDGPAAAQAWRLAGDDDLCALSRLDAEVHALRPSAASRESTRAIGARLLRTWARVRGGAIERLIEGGEPRVATLPVVFGAICAVEAIPQHAAVEAFMYTRLAAVMSCAMRLLSIGQHDAHACLVSTLMRVPAAADYAICSTVDPQSFAPALDIAQMSQQYVESRLFRS
jgi:urease accessory protein